MLSTHLTNNLDRGVRRLLAMWVYVKKDLETSFAVLDREKPEGEQGQGLGEGSEADEPEPPASEVIAVKLFKVRGK